MLKHVSLRRTLVLMMAALLAVGIIGGYNMAFAQVDDETQEAINVVDGNLGAFITLAAAFLVFFMQAGFAFLGAGLIRTKNTTNYMTKSFMDFSIASLSFWAFGFAFMTGASAIGIIGTSNFFLVDDNWVDWMFQMVFAATAATIVAGAIAERTKIQTYMAYSFIVTALIYPLYAHWVWGGGWLGDLSAINLPGAVDYAGSGVVHAVGGFLALAACIVVGPRIGKFNADGTSNVLSGHSTPFVIVGTFILFFGWFGFNIGGGDTIGLNAVNTLLAGATGAVVALYINLVRTGKADILMACNGALAGLVGITAPCAYVDTWAAVVIGALAAPIMMLSLQFLEKVLKVDDPVGAIAVHGFTGLWGLLAVGIFASGHNGVSGLVDGNAKQIVSQLISMAVVAAWALTTGFALFLALKATVGVRATREEELQGLDKSEHGLETYVMDEPPAVAGASGTESVN